MMSEIIKVSENYNYAVENAVKYLKAGSVIIFPTDTVYGMGANLYDIEAIKKIYYFKNRDMRKPLAIYLSEIDSVKQFCEFVPQEFYKLYESFLPGPLTIILKKNNIIPDIVSGGKDTIAIRFVDNQLLTDIINKSGFPLAGTSANISGENSAANPDEVIKNLSGKIDLILNEGNCKYGSESTLISLAGDKPKILRQGVISKDDIEKTLNFKV